MSSLKTMVFVNVQYSILPYGMYSYMHYNNIKGADVINKVRI